MRRILLLARARHSLAKDTPGRGERHEIPREGGGGRGMKLAARSGGKRWVGGSAGGSCARSAIVGKQGGWVFVGRGATAGHSWRPHAGSRGEGHSECRGVF
jgi:hypothetical protein